MCQMLTLTNGNVREKSFPPEPVNGHLASSLKRLQRVEKVSKVELGHMTVRIDPVRRTISCCGKMLYKDE